MFTTTTARAVAQKQAGMFDDDSAADFELTAPQAPAAAKAAAPDWIAAAQRKGATFAQLQADPYGNAWSCSAPVKRGHAYPVATFHHTTQAGAAEAFCRYFGVKP